MVSELTSEPDGLLVGSVLALVVADSLALGLSLRIEDSEGDPDGDDHVVSELTSEPDGLLVSRVLALTLIVEVIESLIVTD